MFKLFLGLAIGMFSVAATSQDLDVLYVGISDSTQTIYIGINPSLTEAETVCLSKGQIRIDANSVIADKVYAGALAALTAGKKISVGVSQSQCLNDNPRIITFLVK